MAGRKVNDFYQMGHFSGFLVDFWCAPHLLDATITQPFGLVQIFLTQSLENYVLLLSLDLSSYGVAGNSEYKNLFPAGLSYGRIINRDTASQVLRKCGKRCRIPAYDKGPDEETAVQDSSDCSDCRMRSIQL